MTHNVKIKKFARQTLLGIYGINKITAKKIVGYLHLHPQALTSNHFLNLNILKNLLRFMFIEHRLRVHVFSRIYLLMLNSTYRGVRHLQHLPTRGQRTHSNAKTQSNLANAGKALPFNLKKYRNNDLSKNSQEERKKKKKNKKSVPKSRQKINTMKKNMKKKINKSIKKNK